MAAVCTLSSGWLSHRVTDGRTDTRPRVINVVVSGQVSGTPLERETERCDVERLGR